jgi:LmbE family N-acetylglucosaminyl deacetylase
VVIEDVIQGAYMTDIMAIAAHPDDVEFGAAGTITRWTREGKRTVYVVCTSGEKGTSDRSVRPEDLADIREAEQRAAAQAVGVNEVVFLRYPDQGLEDTTEFRKTIVRLIRTYRPEIIVTSDPYRRYLWHRDHRITGQVVLDAVFPCARDHLSYPELLQEGLEPFKVREVLFWAAEEVNYCSDITAAFDVKLRALQCHQSQISEFRADNLEAWLRERCQQMADQEDFELGESFHRLILPE